MRGSKGKKHLSCVCSAVLGIGVWSLCNAQMGTAPAADPPRIPGQNTNGIQVYLRAGRKTHGPGQHDYPQFLADGSKLLTAHGAVVSGSLHAPLAQELEGVAVLVIYKGDAGYLSDDDRTALEAFIKHGEVNFTLDANVPYTIVDNSSPLVQWLAGVT